MLPWSPSVPTVPDPPLPYFFPFTFLTGVEGLGTRLLLFEIFSLHHSLSNLHNRKLRVCIFSRLTRVYVTLGQTV